ncbi:MAG: histidine kinase [Chitinophagaceae bacterium]
MADNLHRIIESTTDEKAKLPSIYKLFALSINPDSLLPTLLQAEAIVAKSKDKLEQDKVAMLRANYYLRKNYVDSALHIIDRLLPAYEKDSNQQYYLNLLFFKAKALDRANRYTQALTHLYAVEEKAAALKDTLTQIQAATGIGWVQMEMEQYNEALSWLYKALHFSPDQRFYKNYGALYSNIASVYNAIGKPDSAKTYIEIAIKDARENDNPLFLATALSMQAKIFINSKQPALAEAPLHEVVEIRRQLNDPFYTVYDMSSLASYYANNGQAAKGIQLCEEGITMAKKSGLSSQLLMIYRAMAENYKAAGNIPAYSKTLEDVIALKDSFNNINSAKLLADMKANSDALKKEKTIAEQKLKLTVQNYWLYGAVLFSIMAGIITWLGFKYYHRKQSMKMELALAEEKRIAAQSIIDAEEQERKRIAADLHDNIGAYASAICADVEKLTLNGNGRSGVYLQNLQQHSQEIMASLRDTIWILHKENITITGISDRIKNYLFKLRPSYEQINFSIEEDISNDIRLSSREAFNIFRIVQEALHNALKHSNASKIGLLIVSNGSLLIKVTDNGRGMDNENKQTGNGLQNMQTRAKETGVKVSIHSSAETGTQMVLTNDTTN